MAGCHKTINQTKYLCLWLLVCFTFQELGELREAKQLFIQQKLELQGRVESVQGALEQEQKEHQATRDSRSHREEKLLAQHKDVQDQLVDTLTKFSLIHEIKCHSLPS